MRAGALRDRVLIQRQGSAGSGYVREAADWYTLAEARAHIKPLSATREDETVIADSLAGVSAFEITVRFHNAIARLTPADRLVDARTGDVLNITHVAQPDRRNRKLVITAVLGMGEVDLASRKEWVLSGVLDFAPLTLSGTIDSRPAVRGEFLWPLLSLTANANVRKPATGALQWPAMTLSGVFADLPDISGAFAFQPLAVTSSASVRRTASGGVALPALAATASASVQRQASGTLVLPPLAFSDWPVADYYLASDGSDANAGNDNAAPWQSIAHMLANAASGETVGLRSGDVIDPGPTSFFNGQSLIAQTQATVDARSDLGALTWTNTSGNVWTASVTLREEPLVANGVNASSFHYMIWDGETMLEWEFAGADIAANTAAVAANPGSFTIHQTGSTIPDPRDDSGTVNTREFTLFVHRADGSDPNGADLYGTDRNKVLDQVRGGRVENVAFIGNFWKDAVGAAIAADGTVPVFHNVSTLDAPQHGLVGPLNITGTFRYTGRGTPGSVRFPQGGGAVNLFTAVDLTDRDLTFETIDAFRANQAFYGHGALPNRGYRNLDVDHLIARECIAAVKFDPAGTIKFIVGRTRVALLEATRVQNVLEPSGDAIIESGSVVFATEAEEYHPSGRQRLSYFTTANDSRETHTIRNFDVTCNLGGNGDRTLAYDWNVNHASGVDCELVLDNVRDLTVDPDKMLHIPQHSGLHPVRLRLINGTQLGDLHRSPSWNGWPAYFRAEAGTRFGFGNRTGPEIEAAMTAAGVDFVISDDTTIVGRNGQILSLPGWRAAPTYAVAWSAASVDEGSSVTATVTTTAVANGTDVPYVITGVSAADIDVPLTGDITINANTGSLTVTLAEDASTEGAETMTISIQSGADSASVTVNDTSEDLTMADVVAAVQLRGGTIRVVNYTDATLGNTATDGAGTQPAVDAVNAVARFDDPFTPAQFVSDNGNTGLTLRSDGGVTHVSSAGGAEVMYFETGQLVMDPLFVFARLRVPSTAPNFRRIFSGAASGTPRVRQSNGSFQEGGSGNFAGAGGTEINGVVTTSFTADTWFSGKWTRSVTGGFLSFGDTADFRRAVFVDIALTPEEDAAIQTWIAETA